MTGDYDGFEGSSHLQQIRNTCGPSWVKLLPGGGLSTKERPTGMFTVESQFIG
jgi:hypothetical protein